MSISPFTPLKRWIISVAAEGGLFQPWCLVLLCYISNLLFGTFFKLSKMKVMILGRLLLNIQFSFTKNSLCHLTGILKVIPHCVLRLLTPGLCLWKWVKENVSNRQPLRSDVRAAVNHTSSLRHTCPSRPVLRAFVDAWGAVCWTSVFSSIVK